MKISDVLDVLYPRRCPVCQEIIEENRLCEKCRRKVSYIRQPRCLKCGKQIETMEEELCSDCRKKTHFFDRGIGLFAYDENVKNSLYRFKYSNKREYAAVYAKELFVQYGEILKRWDVQAVVPVPMYRDKMRQRGFNQAECIAVELSKLLGVGVEKNLIERVRNTKPMKELDDKERMKNLERAFNISEDSVKYKRILLVDDIYTTGATVDSCALLLKEKGVSKVYFAAVCIGNGF